MLVRIWKSICPIIPGSIYVDGKLFKIDNEWFLFKLRILNNHLIYYIGLHRPDMYGALWVMISLFICIPIFGNLNDYFHMWKDNDLANYHSNITKMWKIMTSLIIYFFLFPFIVHNFFKCGKGIGSVDSRYFFLLLLYMATDFVLSFREWWSMQFLSKRLNMYHWLFPLCAQ